MNMRVASDSIVAEEPLVTARLPGEPEEAEEIEASEPEEPEAQQPPRRARRVNRKVLLAGVAVGALVAGVGFLVSPYNHVVPLPARVRAAASLVWNRQPLLAPSAELAQVTLPPPSGPAVRTPYVGQPPSQQVNEVVALRAGAPASTQSSGRPAEVSSPPAPPSPPAARPATPPTPASAPAAVWRHGRRHRRAAAGLRAARARKRPRRRSVRPAWSEPASDRDGNGPRRRERSSARTRHLSHGTADGFVRRGRSE